MLTGNGQRATERQDATLAGAICALRTITDKHTMAPSGTPGYILRTFVMGEELR